ncbi:MAG: sigma-54-dependent transcriptional regulator [Fibrobacterota bacterium]
MSTILFIDKNTRLREEMYNFLTQKEYEVYATAEIEGATGLLDQLSFDLVVADAGYQLDLLQSLLGDLNEKNGNTLMVVTSERSDLENAHYAAEKGAYDILQKPYDPSELEQKIQHILEVKRLQREAQSLRGERNIIYKPENFIGESEGIIAVFNMISKIQNSDSSVLLTGETGTGKELVAGAIHYTSNRAANPFVKVNCAALPDELLENELFGHEKGAYTGAHDTRIGRFEQADGGSIFLDEVGDMRPKTQAKVLRVIQEKEFERLGSNKTVKVDVRIISATNKNLEEEIRKGDFREDLYYRLNVISLKIPPLRERQEDIIPLAIYFIKKYSGDLKKQVQQIHPLAKEVLKEHSWPGNVRELQNIIERAVLLSEGDEITIEDLDIPFKKKAKTAEPNKIEISPEGFNLKEIEKGYIIQALKICGWNQKEAATLLDISRRSLNYKVKKYNITHPSWRENKPEEDAD